MPDEKKPRVEMKRKRDGLVVHVPESAVEFRKALGYDVVKASDKTKEA